MKEHTNDNQYAGGEIDKIDLKWKLNLNCFSFSYVDKFMMKKKLFSPSVKIEVVVPCWAKMLSLNDTQIMAIEDFQQSLNNSCFRGINVKCLLPFINYNKSVSPYTRNMNENYNQNFL